MVDHRRRTLFRFQRKSEPQPLPWVRDDVIFTDQCSRCGKCLEACDTGIVIAGEGGFPALEFNKGECTFCYKCAEVCPEPLFKTKEEAPWEQIARIGNSCLSKTGVECRSCGDACEPRAIRFALAAGTVAQPKINESDCTGCGACVSPCPVAAIAMEFGQ